MKISFGKIKLFHRLQHLFKKIILQFVNSVHAYSMIYSAFASQTCFGIALNEDKKLDLEHKFLLLGSAFLMVNFKTHSDFNLCEIYNSYTYEKYKFKLL